MLAVALALATRSGAAESTRVLTIKQQQLIAISAWTARGDLEQLRVALADGLTAGWTINELKEAIVQLYAYAGFPRSLNALNTFMEVLARRRSEGKVDVVGREPSAFPANETNIERGVKLQGKLVGERPPASYATFAPVIDEFLKGHLFGDVLARDNLDLESRELVTLAALATLNDVDPQLASHVRVALRLGISEEQLHGVANVIDAKIDRARGENAQRVLVETLRTSSQETLEKPASRSP